MAAVLTFSATAQAQTQDCYDFCNEDPCCENNNPFYAEILGGANFLQITGSASNSIKCKTGYVVSGSLGYRLCYGVRVEAEYVYRKTSLNTVKFVGHHVPCHGYFQSSSYMVNALWDIPLSSWGCDFWKVQPFIGAGIGYDCLKVKARAQNTDATTHGSKKGFAWQLMIGGAYPIYCNTDISLEYKFHKGSAQHLYNHSVGVGLTYNFGS